MNINTIVREIVMKEMDEIKKPTSVPDKHQHKIAVDTVKNPSKGFLGGPSAEEAEEILRTKFGYTDKDIAKLKEVIKSLVPNIQEGSKLYVGVNGMKHEVFRSSSEPTKESHGKKYKAVIGPFRTKDGAEYMAKYGANNPHLQTVADAERIAKQEKGKMKETSTTASTPGYNTPNAFSDEDEAEEKKKKMGIVEGKKRFRINYNIGKSKYSINFHDGKKKHNDGSDFFDLRIFKNKKDLETATNDLKKKGYIEESITEGKHAYTKFKEEDGTPRQKLGRSVMEVRDNLLKLEKILKLNLKMQNETELQPDQYWKNTHKAINRIDTVVERIKEMLDKVKGNNWTTTLQKKK